MRLESWIEQLVEEPFVRLFAGRLLPQEVARRLVQALEDGERVGADGNSEVPGRYRIALNTKDLDALRRHHPDLETQLERALKSLADRMKIRLQEPPSVLLVGDEKLPPRAVNITPADRTPLVTQQTRDLDIERLQTMLVHEEKPQRAYVIVEGERTFDLLRPTIRIGRALDNDLILEDRRISRYHAQLRSRHGRYILEDLGSSGGTNVNGFPIQEIVLRPGDIISLAGYTLIYGEEEVGRRDRSGETQPYTTGEG